MKQIYFLMTVVAMSTSAIAQQVILSEDFNALTAGGNTTSTGATAPNAADIYSSGTTDVLPNFPTGLKGYSAGGMIKLGTSSSEGSITSKVIDLSSNNGEFTIDLDVKGWTRTPAKFTVNLLQNGTVYSTKDIDYTAVMAGSTEKVSATFTDGKANSSVQIITNTDAYRLYIDNLTITTKNLSTIDYAEASKAVSNTLWANEASFNVKDKSVVEIYNINGQLVKTFEVKGVQTVNVSNLVKGIYIVKTTSNGKTSTQKVVKK